MARNLIVTSHENCIVCGTKNPLSLGLKFTPDSKGLVTATFCGNSCLQGYDGILHGGIISTLLDSAMTHCLFHQGIEAVTGDLRVRFIAPVPFDATVTIRAAIPRITFPLYHIRSELTCSGKIMAWAEGKFMHKDSESISNLEYSSSGKQTVDTSV